MSYLKNGQKLFIEINELKLKQVRLKKEINRDEVKLEFLKSNFKKSFITKNIKSFEMELYKKEEELIKIGEDLKDKV